MEKKKLIGTIIQKKECICFPLDLNNIWPGRFILKWNLIGSFACRLYDKPGHHVIVTFNLN